MESIVERPESVLCRRAQRTLTRAPSRDETVPSAPPIGELAQRVPRCGVAAAPGHDVPPRQGTGRLVKHAAKRGQSRAGSRSSSGSSRVQAKTRLR